MASRLKRNQQGAVTVSASESHDLASGMFSLYQLAQSSNCDTRKKRKSKQSLVNHTLTPYFDGHLWRKYGQKIIKDAPYPRLYFRCSYREDRHCMASKLLQQVNNDPPLYEVTYTHEHTCNAVPVPPPDVVAAATAPVASDGLVLSFGSSGSGHHRNDLMQQKRQHFHHQCQSVPPPDQFPTSSFHSSNCQPAFSSPNVPCTASLWLSSFPTTTESSPASSPSTVSYSDDNMLFSTVDWDSFSCLIDQFDDYSQ